MKQLVNTTLLKAVLIVSALFLSTIYDASASSYPARLGAKLGNSIANASTGIVEIPKTIMVTNREHGMAYAATAGLERASSRQVFRRFCDHQAALIPADCSGKIFAIVLLPRDGHRRIRDELVSQSHQPVPIQGQAC